MEEYRYAEIKRRLESIETKMDSVVLRRDLYEADQRTAEARIEATEDRLARLEDAQSWAFRFILAEAVSIIVGLALTFLR